MPFKVDGVKVFVFLLLAVSVLIVSSSFVDAVSECVVYKDLNAESWKCGGSNSCSLPDDLDDRLSKFGGRKYSDCSCPVDCSNPDAVGNPSPPYKSDTGKFFVEDKYLSACTIDVSFWPSEDDRRAGTGNPDIPEGWNLLKKDIGGNKEMCENQCIIVSDDYTKSLFDGRKFGCNVDSAFQCVERLDLERDFASQCIWETRKSREIFDFPSNPINVEGCYDSTLLDVIAEGRWSEQLNPAGWYTLGKVNNKRVDRMNDRVEIGFDVEGIFCRIDFETQCGSDIQNRDVKGKIFVDNTDEVLWTGLLDESEPDRGYDLAYDKHPVLSRDLTGNERLSCEIEIGEFRDVKSIGYRNDMAISVDRDYVNTDEIVRCSGEVFSDSGSKEFDVIVNVEGGSGTGNPSGVEHCTIENGESCSVHVLIPKEYTRVGDKIECKMRAYDGVGYSEEKKAGIEIYNRAPILKKVEITPDFMKIYKKEDWVKYSDIFEQEMNCVFKAIDLDEEDSILNYEVKFNVKPFDGHRNGQYGRREFTLDGNVQCANGDVCSFIVNEENIYPSDSQKCSVKVSDSFGGSSEKQDGNVMPYFDLYFDKIETMNVASGGPLIANKPITARVFVGVKSELIDVVDREFRVMFMADNGEDVYKVYMENVNDLWRLGSKELYKNKALEVVNAGKIGTDYLRKMKKAEDSVNFVNVRFPKEGDYKFSLKIDPVKRGVIKESIEVNNVNKNVETKKVWRQKKVYSIGIVPITDGADGGFSAADKKKVERGIAFMFAGSPLSPSLSIVKYLPELKINYDRTKLSNLDVAAAKYADEIQDDLFKEKLEDMRKAKNFDLVVGIVLDKHVLLHEENAFAEGLSLGTWKNVLVYRNAGPDTILHEMSHVYTDRKEHVDVAFEESGWCTNQYGTYDVCALSTGEAVYGKSAPRINIWTEFKKGENEHLSGLDIPEFMVLTGGEMGQLNMGRRYTNIHSKTSGFPNVWHNLKYYGEMRSALGSYFKKP